MPQFNDFFQPPHVLYGFCACGCGQLTEIESGVPRRLVRGHRYWQPFDVKLFWSKVDVRGFDDCWEWKGYSSLGYGRINFRGVGIGTHRVAWMIANGRDIGEDMMICHRCDNRPCCNPFHLFEGTIIENTTDMVQKNRQAKGERMGAAKLTEEQVRWVKTVYVRGSSEYGGKPLARKLGVAQKQIQSIINGTGWKHVTVDQQEAA